MSALAIRSWLQIRRDHSESKRSPQGKKTGRLEAFYDSGCLSGRGAKTEREKDTADIKCTSPNCPAQLERHIINFVGRDAMDIKGFGTVYIEELVRLGYIKDIADIFELKDHREELIEQGIIGKEKNTDKLLETIEKAKENDAYMLLTGFGIPNVGKAAAKTIMKRFSSILDLEDADRDALMEVDDVGEVSATAFSVSSMMKKIKK